MSPARRPSACPSASRCTAAHGVAVALLVALPLALEAQRPQLAQGEPSAAQVAALLAGGDSAWTRGSRDDAFAYYAAVLRRDAAAPTRVVFRLATLSAERNALDDAVRLYRTYVAREPGDAAGRVALARTLAWQGRHADAVAMYDSVLARDPRHREAVLGRAQALAWADRHTESLAAYAAWLAETPDDGEAVRARAQVLAWAGRLTDAEAAYRDRLARESDVEAARGLARVIAWRGDLTGSARAWRELVAQDSTDVDAWFGLAEVLHWDGRADDAARALDRALALAPARADVRALRDAVQADRRTAAEPTVLYSRDSDGNLVHSLGLTMAPRAWGGLRWRLAGSFRSATDPTRSASAAGARLQAAWATAGRGLVLSTEAGATRLASRANGAVAEPRREATRSWLVARLAGRPHRGVEAGLAFAAVPFDETAPLIARGVHTRAVDADVTVALPGHLALGLAGGHLAVLGGQVANARRALVSSLRWSPTGATSVGVTWRQVGWDTLGRADGYFAPHRFDLLELGARRTLGREIGWRLTVDGGLGRQLIRFSPDAEARGTAALRGSVAVQYAPRAGYAIELLGGATSVASAVTRGDSEYRQHWLTLRGRAPVF
jgi:tetratricopeptide (TPR) repeat protein